MKERSLKVLKIREAKLLELLKNQDAHKPVHFFAKQLEVSDKTIRNDLDNLMYLFDEYDLEIERVQGQGIKLLELTKNEFERLMSELDVPVFKDESKNITSRRRNIIYYLLVNSDKYTSIQKLSEEYYVSVSGIVNDFKVIEQWLNKNQLELYRGQEGTKIKGDEIKIRKALAQFILDFPSVEPQNRDDEVFESRLDSVTRNKLLEMFEYHEIEFFEDVISDIEIYTDVDIVDPYYINLMTHLLISVQRSKYSDNLSTKSEPLDNDIPFYTDIVEFIANKVEKYFKVTYSLQEKQYILQFILGTLSSQDIHSADAAVSNCVFKLVNYMDELTDNKFMLDDALIKSLMLHMQPMMNRVRYGIKINNPLWNMLLETHQILFMSVRYVTNYLMKDEFENQLTLDEISYLVTYFAASLERKTTEINCVVVCHSGYGTSQLLTARLNKNFSNINITNVISTNHIKNLDYQDVDMIISTVYIENPPAPYIVVSAFLDENEKARINAFINQNINTLNSKTNCSFEELTRYLTQDKLNIKEALLLYKNETQSLFVANHKEKQINIKKEDIYLLGSNEETSAFIKCINVVGKKKNLEEIIDGFIKTIK